MTKIRRRSAISAQEADAIREEVSAALLPIAEKHELSLRTVIGVAEGLTDPRVKPFFASDVIADVCAKSGVAPDQIKSCFRSRKLMDARMVISHRLRQRGWSYPRIGQAMHRDHSSIIHLVRKAEARIPVDSAFAALCQEAD